MRAPSTVYVGPRPNIRTMGCGSTDSARASAFSQRISVLGAAAFMMLRSLKLKNGCDGHPLSSVALGLGSSWSERLRYIVHNYASSPRVNHTGFPAGNFSSNTPVHWCLRLLRPSKGRHRASPSNLHGVRAHDRPLPLPAPPPHLASRTSPRSVGGYWPGSRGTGHASRRLLTLFLSFSRFYYN